LSATFRPEVGNHGGKSFSNPLRRREADESGRTPSSSPLPVTVVPVRHTTRPTDCARPPRTGWTVGTNGGSTSRPLPVSPTSNPSWLLESRLPRTRVVMVLIPTTWTLMPMRSATELPTRTSSITSCTSSYLLLARLC
jgi:hypothetical protein